MARPSAPDPKPIRPPPSWLSSKGLGGFHRSVGFTVERESTGAGVCVVGGVVKARHLNINGVVHGGVYATILDTAMGGAVVTTLREDEVTATTSLYIEFLRPAEKGATLRARGEVVRRGRHLAFVEGNLYDGEGVRLSQAHGTWYIWAAGDGTWTRGGPPSTAARRRR
jgi:uncharacterized protein (TIGR00369 family)